MGALFLLRLLLLEGQRFKSVVAQEIEALQGGRSGRLNLNTESKEFNDHLNLEKQSNVAENICTVK